MVFFAPKQRKIGHLSLCSGIVLAPVKVGMVFIHKRKDPYIEGSSIAECHIVGLEPPIATPPTICTILLISLC